VKCPKCCFGKIVYQPWNKKDLVARCSHTKKCGLRVHIVDGKDMTEEEKTQIVLDRWEY